MVREAAVKRTEQLDDVSAQALEKRRRHGRSGAIAGIEHDFFHFQRFRVLHEVARGTQEIISKLGKGALWCFPDGVGALASFSMSSRSS